MKNITDTADERHKSWCIHCGAGIGEKETNRDHVPSKSFLEKPYPPELPTVDICRECNTSFSHDEEYLAAFLGAVLSGTTDPAEQKTAIAARIFTRNTALRQRIEARKKSYVTIGADQKVIWEPELRRIQNVMVKNARGHVYYELGQPALGEPASAIVRTLESLSQDELSGFLTIDHGAGWPEVGCRVMTRLCTGDDMADGWIVVQDGIYRFAAVESDGFHVRMIVREYFAAEVIWGY